MAKDVILPALGMSQDTGKIVQWLKAEGDRVVKDEPLVEIETDKATVEIEASADGVLARISAAAGEDVPVGQVIAVILTPDEASAMRGQDGMQGKDARQEKDAINRVPTMGAKPEDTVQRMPVPASPLASRIAAEHNVDLSRVKSAGKRIQKADVLTYLQDQVGTDASHDAATPRLLMASPKARRLAGEQGKNLATIKGTGPQGAVLAADVLAASKQAPLSAEVFVELAPSAHQPPTLLNGAAEQSLSNVWRIMAERTTQSWTDTPHFYLIREINASRLIAWRAQVLKRVAEKVTYTDLLVKVVAAALRVHPRVNASWSEGKLFLKQAIHVGLAVAVEEGLVVPVIHDADSLNLGDLARQRVELVARAQAGKLRPRDISDGTFTISNLGMYNVDAFSAIINQPQVAILAVGRIVERVVPVNGQPAVQPMMTLTLSCDHRAVDGARGAQFLDTIASFLEEPLGLLG